MPPVPQTTIRPAEDAFDWVNRALGGVLGLPAARLPLRRDRPLHLASADEISLLARQIESRFQRRRDPATGRTEYGIADPLLAPDQGRGLNNGASGLLSRFLPPIRQAVSGIDPGFRPEAAQIEALRAFTLKLLDHLESDLLGGAHQASITRQFKRIDEQLKTAEDAICVSAKTVAEEEQRQAVGLARTQLAFLEKAWKEHAAPGHLGTPFSVVENCARGIADQAEMVCELLEEIGVSLCQLEGIKIRDGAKTADSDCLATGNADEIDLNDLLLQTRTRPSLWVRLAACGGEPELELIREEAADISELFSELIELEQVAPDRLCLTREDGDRFFGAFGRLARLVGTFSERIGKPAGHGGAPGPALLASDPPPAHGRPRRTDPLDEDRHRAISERAYEIWKARGEGCGDPERDWRQAEQEYEAARARETEAYLSETSIQDGNRVTEQAATVEQLERAPIVGATPEEDR